MAPFRVGCRIPGKRVGSVADQMTSVPTTYHQCISHKQTVLLGRPYDIKLVKKKQGFAIKRVQYSNAFRLSDLSRPMCSLAGNV